MQFFSTYKLKNTSDRCTLIRVYEVYADSDKEHN